MKKKSLHLISAITVGAIIVAATSYGVWKMKMNKDIDNAIVNVEQNGNDAQGIDTSDWKTYTNADFGYQIKYPKNWTVVDNNPYTQPKSIVQFNVSVSRGEGSFFRISIPMFGHGGESYEKISEKEINLDGIAASKKIYIISNGFKEVSIGNENIIFIDFKDKKFNYESGIEFLYSNVNQKNYLEIFDNMINSFRFLN